MKKKERILKAIEEDIVNIPIMKVIKKESYFSTESFHESCERYINAIKEGRMICSIDAVSNSGMSRTIKFLECKKYKNRSEYGYLNFFMLFKILGYLPSGRYSDYFRIYGCGMDMIFHTNYTIIHRLKRLGFISKKQCERLAQQTPSVI